LAGAFGNHTKGFCIAYSLLTSGIPACSSDQAPNNSNSETWDIANSETTSGITHSRDKEQAKHEAFFHACSSPCVIGSVAMWGEVIEHQRGWRSEYAAVQSITEITGDISLLSKQWLL
jgi:hypothetical protein